MDKRKSKIGLITGSSRGIGRASALSLASAGGDVGGNHRSRHPGAARCHGPDLPGRLLRRVLLRERATRPGR